MHNNLLRAVYNRPWAIQPNTLEAIAEIIYRHVSGQRLTRDQIDARIAREDRRGQSAASAGAASNAGGLVAIIPVQGVIGHRARMVEDTSSGIGTSTELTGRHFDAALRDPQITAILLDVNSPGGTVDGVQELSDKIFAARGTKPIHAIANTTAASAAYWIASAADKLHVTPSGEVGSVGVYLAHADISAQAARDGIKVTYVYKGKYKVEGNPYEPLADDARASLQNSVDGYYRDFIEAVARNRGVSVANAEADFGQGRMFRAADAITRKMADSISTIESATTQLLTTDPSITTRRLRTRLH